MTESGASQSGETKRQHYVPQFLLREFSSDPERASVGVYIQRRDLFIAAVPIKRQAYEDYFYGRDGKLERTLGDIENRAAPIVRNIIATRAVPAEFSFPYADLLMFSILLHARTKKHADKTDEWLDKTIKTVYGDHPTFGADLKKVNVAFTNAAQFAVINSFEASLLGSDLRCRLLLNKTPESLICSDDPTVFYNELMETKKLCVGGAATGFMGFQAFLPISPKHCLYYFDGDVYGVGSKSDAVVEVTNATDIHSLNLLQAINSWKCLFFDATVSKQMCARLSDQAMHFRGYGKVTVKKTEIETIGTRKRSIVTSGFGDIRCGLNLSFSRILKKAKAFEIGTRLIHPRRSPVVELFIKYRSLCQQGSAQPGTFHKYMMQYMKNSGPTFDLP